MHTKQNGYAQSNRQRYILVFDKVVLIMIHTPHDGIECNLFDEIISILNGKFFLLD